MYSSLKIGTAFGIPIRLHWTFLAGIYLLFLLDQNVLTLLPLLAVLFGCVLLHELGHSLVARGFGLRVVDITLWPLGGIARMSEIPENSRIEGLIAIAGPAVNFALAGFGLLMLVLDGTFEMGADQAIAAFVALNVFQGASNLLPAFPMDGGRLLRAFLGRKRDWLSATEIAVRVGRFVVLLMFLASIAAMYYLPEGTCLLPLTALFVWWAGTKELLAVRMRHGASPFGAAGGGAWRPAEARSAPAPGPAPAPAPEPGTAQRPLNWMQRQFRRGGFSEEEVRWLEAYRGRLRPPPDGSS